MTSSKRARTQAIGSITFKGNPWPKGHALVEFAWLGHLDDDGAWFDLHLESDDYYANDPPPSEDDEPETTHDEWKSKDSWGNYHRCTLSSTHWGDEKGFLVGTEKKKLAFAKLSGRTFNVDPADTYANDNAAFHVYLLGHDSVASHRIRFTRSKGDEYSIEWNGKIALTYVGDDEFKHRFHVVIPRVRFSGFVLPEGAKKADAKALATKFLAEPDAFTLKTRDKRLWLVPSTQ